MHMLLTKLRKGPDSGNLSSKRKHYNFLSLKDTVHSKLGTLIWKFKISNYQLATSIRLDTYDASVWSVNMLTQDFLKKVTH